MDTTSTKDQPQQFEIDFMCEGYTGRIIFNVHPSKLHIALRRLNDEGIIPIRKSMPTMVEKDTLSPDRKAKGPVKLDAWYNGDGVACCPTHKRPLRMGKWGPFCSAKNEDGKYCNLKFKDDIQIEAEEEAF